MQPEKPETADLRASMKANGLTQINFFDGQLIGFARKKDGGDFVSLEVSVDFKRMKVSATTIRESADKNSMNRFKEVDYKEAGWRTHDEASQLIGKYCRVLPRSKRLDVAATMRGHAYHF